MKLKSLIADRGKRRRQGLAVIGNYPERRRMAVASPYFAIWKKIVFIEGGGRRKT
jgi:hypothetical protein